MIRLAFRRRRSERLAAIGEAEAYGRSYGERSTDVRIVKVEPRRQRGLPSISGERLRRLFEERLEGRARERDSP